MDFSGVLLIPLAAATTAIWLVVAAVLGRKATLRAPFLVSYAFAVILVQPWLVASWQEAGMVAVMLSLTSISIAAGCLVGAMAAMVTIAIARRLARSDH